jgi:hypothetical protein
MPLIDSQVFDDHFIPLTQQLVQKPQGLLSTTDVTLCGRRSEVKTTEDLIYNKMTMPIGFSFMREVADRHGA